MFQMFKPVTGYKTKTVHVQNKSTTIIIIFNFLLASSRNTDMATYPKTIDTKCEDTSQRSSQNNNKYIMYTLYINIYMTHKLYNTSVLTI